MLVWWSSTVIRARWLVLAAGLVLALAGAVWGSGVFGSLVNGGFDDPASASARVQQIAARLGVQSPDVVVLYSSRSATVDDPAFRGPVSAALRALERRPGVAHVVSYYQDAGVADGLVSRDRHATYAAITLTAPDDTGKRAAYQSLRPALDVHGVRTQVGGLTAFNVVTDDLTKQDVSKGEMLAMPVVLVLLVFIFGGLVAAGMPLLIGILAILGSLTITRLLTQITDVSTFAVNIITVLGLGMAIDYSLLIISRFREHLRAGNDTPAAVAATMATAGRTVLVSGTLICLSLASLLIFPQVFLQSMGLGGIAGVLLAMTGALTVLPALLAVLGPRINALRIPLPGRNRRTGRAGDPGQQVWAALAQAVMRRPVQYLAAVVAVLAILAIPFGHAHFGGLDERILPPGSQPRMVTARIQTEFPGGTTDPIQVVLRGATPLQAQHMATRIQAQRGITGVRPAGSRGDTTLLAAGYAGASTGPQASDAVHAIRNLPTPAGVTMLVGGRTAQDMDRIHSLAVYLPWMAAIMATVTLVLLFLAFGSVLLPVKAVVMNLVSIGASFGVVIWIFQDGHLSHLLGFTATGFLEPSTPVFLLAALFGLATDYEVFLLARVREEYDATGDNTTAVATGLQRTGQIITSAALLLIVVLAGLATGQVVFAKIIGIGMLTAITVDAALVRTLLVPATMRLLGRWNWWAPGPLATLYRRYGISEATSDSPAVPRPTTPALTE
jgi:uncharacterized membrane protein YdfJ with MMPL/SSD domain